MADITNILSIPTTYQIPEEQDELRRKLYQYFSDISQVTNNKISGYCFEQEFVNGKTYFVNQSLASTNPNYNAPRAAFQTVINFGALPNTATKSVAHNIKDIASSGTFSFTNISACASNQAASLFIPVPAQWITVDATNVNITTPADYTAYNVCIVYLEYLKF